MIIQELLREECLRVLGGTNLGRLGCSYLNQPYVVPIHFAYHDSCLYGFTTRGQKIDWMRYNPLVCVEVDEVVDLEHWTSVIAFGQYEELASLPDWKDPSLHALDLLNQRAGWWKAGCASSTYWHAEQPVDPIFYRIRIERISGRKAMAGANGSASTSEPSPPALTGSWLLRMRAALKESMTRWLGRKRRG
jgi:nitroimidazol reductase NimA-like FMN-containing flavoprotein (pyridoxamine 5'-phosphate oxidase superfamily)